MFRPTSSRVLPSPVKCVPSIGRSPCGHAPRGVPIGDRELPGACDRSEKTVRRSCCWSEVAPRVPRLLRARHADAPRTVLLDALGAASFSARPACGELPIDGGEERRSVSGTPAPAPRPGAPVHRLIADPEPASAPIHPALTITIGTIPVVAVVLFEAGAEIAARVVATRAAAAVMASSTAATIAATASAATVTTTAPAASSAPTAASSAPAASASS